MQIKCLSIILLTFSILIQNPIIGLSQTQGCYIEEEVTSPPIFGTESQNTLTQTWILEDKIRRDEEAKLQTTIIRSDLGKIWLINHSDTTYREVSQEMCQGLAMIGLMMFGVTYDSLTGVPIIPDPLFHKTYRTSKIGEWIAHEFTISQRGKGQLANSVKRMSLWISKDTGLDSKIYSRMMRKMFGDLGSDYDDFFRQLESLEGYPVLVETRMMGMEMKQKLIKTERRPIPMSLFEIPKEYKKQILDF
jgi:hypothetical protein